MKVLFNTKIDTFFWKTVFGSFIVSLSLHLNAQESFDQLKNNYSGTVTWDANTSTVIFTSSGTINFTNKATNYSDPYGGQTLQAANWMWNVPTTVQKIIIKKNVTITGGFHTKGNITIAGEDQNTSVIYGTPLQSWADKNNPTGQNLDEWHYCQIQVYGGVCNIQKLKILDPFSFAVRGWGPQIHMKKVSVIDTRGGWGNHSDGFEGGDNSTIDSCYFETGDDNIKVYFKNLLVTNTEIVMVQNSVPIQFGWGNYNENASVTFENCKITGTYGRGSDMPIIDNAGSTQRNKTVVMNNCYLENINGTIFRTAVAVAAPTAINVTINNSYVKVKKYESAGYNANGTRTICGTTNKLTFYDCRVSVPNPSSDLTTFSYPTATGQAFLSDKYDVYVKVGNEAEQKLQVLMSDVNYRTMYDGDWMKAENKDRTFSFVHIDYDKAGPGLKFRVVKKFGVNSTSAKISPKSYGYVPTLTSGKELTFTMNDTSKYISINFEGVDNQSPTKSWIKNMLCIFVDPPESNKPNKNGAGVVVYAKTASSASLSNASTIYFPAGYHNLREYANGGLIDADGAITIKSGQSLYLEGGAFVEGVVKRTAYGDVNQKIYGRGILTGRQYYWDSHPNSTGKVYDQLIEVGNNALVSGIMYMESPNHGLVGRSVHLKNVKFLGWHANHDGVRVGGGSEIHHSFLRAVDDHFYNFNIWVHDCVLWAGHNGSIMTYGWGGDVGSNNYGAGGSTMENIDIINPEWTSLGNNNGLIMAQVGYNHPVNGLTIMRNIRIEGSISGITNLKPRSSGTTNTAVQVASADVSFLGNLLMENVSVEAVYGKGVIRGEVDPDFDGTKKWLVKDCAFNNITIGGVCVTESNKANFFVIDANTIQNVKFSCTSVNQKPVVSFTSPLNNATYLIGSDVNVKVNATDSDGSIVLVKLYLNNSLLNRQLTTSPYEWAVPNGTNDTRLRNMQAGTYMLKIVAYDNEGDSTVVSRTFNVTSVTDLENINEVDGTTIKIYPNPCINKLHVIASDIHSVELMNFNGELLETWLQEVDFSNLDISKIPTGVYLLRLKYADLISTQKIVIY